MTKAPGIAPFYPKRSLVNAQLGGRPQMTEHGQGQSELQWSRSASIASSVSDLDSASVEDEKERTASVIDDAKALRSCQGQRRFSEQSSDSLPSEASNNTRDSTGIGSDSDTIADLDHSDTERISAITDSDKDLLTFEDESSDENKKEKSEKEMKDHKNVVMKCESGSEKQTKSEVAIEKNKEVGQETNQDTQVFQKVTNLPNENEAPSEVSMTTNGIKPTLLQLSQMSPEQVAAGDNENGKQNRNMTLPSPKSEDNASYVAKLTYKGLKKLQPFNNNSITALEQPEEAQHSSSEDGSSSPDKSKPQKVFNPFPGRNTSSFTHRLMNSKKTQNGIRLGLYSADSVPFTEGATKKPSFVSSTNISRSQINACLHRQYMAEVKQKARGYKQ